MPMKPPRPCTKPGCAAYSVKQGRCADHPRPQWVKNNPNSGKYGWAWSKKRDKILKRDGYLCQPCYRQHKFTEAKEVDHVVPKAAGGSERDSNLEAICHTCHKIKTRDEAQRGRGRSESREDALKDR